MKKARHIRYRKEDFLCCDLLLSMAMREIRALPQLSTLSQVIPYSALEGNKSISNNRSAALVKLLFD